ncbi:phosphoglycerate kinase [Candidatus Saccharibacteria bacterium]|nr:phosphoglycerate kinase [Candidatus Saccharibacteria bacterium]
MVATIKDVDFKGQNVLVRVDYNVPMQDGKITDDLRIVASLPTIKYLREHGARRIVLISHFGRPEGKRAPELSLKPIAEHLQKLIPDTKVEFVDEVSGPEVEEAVENLPDGGILVLENLRFFPGEEADSDEFAREIVDATHADLFVQDGFAVIHRAHASTDAVARELPSVAGLLLGKEIANLSKVADNPKHPFLVVIGGAKVEDKQPLIDKFLPVADQIFVGGKIAADGYKSDNLKIVVASDFSDDQKFDIGEESTAKVLELASRAKTVLWNGALGKAEDKEYEKASKALAEFLGQHPEITSVICGGDTTSFVENLQKQEPNLEYMLVSTGGGAALELLTGEDLPGLEALEGEN